MTAIAVVHVQLTRMHKAERIEVERIATIGSTNPQIDVIGQARVIGMEGIENSIMPIDNK